jgi:hypothetical protein
MTIHWELLIAVFVVPLGAAVAVVALVALALVGLSARVGHTSFSPRAGSVVAGTCSAAAAVIVLFGLWEIVGG